MKTILDLCSGIGGFHLGFERAGYKIAAWCEINEQARAVYEHHWPNLPNWSDITKIDASEVPDIDIITAGIPCQSFSLAGHRRGMDDARGTLVYDVLRITKAKLPKYVVIENVPGLMSDDKGRTIQTMMRLFSDIGYGVGIRRMYSQDHVPQHRERIFIICKRELGWMAPAWSRPKSDKRIVQDILEPFKSVEPSLYLTKEQCEKYLMAERGGLRQAERSIITPHGNNHKSRRTVSSEGISMTLTTDHEMTKVITERTINMPNGNKHDSDKTCQSHGLSPSLRVGGGPPKVMTERKIQRVGNKPYIGSRPQAAEGIAQTLKSESGSGNTPRVLVERKLDQVANIGEHQADRLYSADGLSCTQTGTGGGGGVNTGKYVIPISAPKRGAKRQNGRRAKEQDDDSYTLTAQDKHGILVSTNHNTPDYPAKGEPFTYLGTDEDADGHGIVWGYNGAGQLTPFHVRQFTVKEGLRLQGFPDDWLNISIKSKKMGKTACQRLIGNAVTVPVIEHLANLLKW